MSFEIHTHTLRGRVSIDLPDTWGFEDNGEAVTVYRKTNPKGALQLSFYSLSHEVEDKAGYAMRQLERFVEQFQIDLDASTKVSLHANGHHYAQAKGKSTNGQLLMIWMIVKGNDFMLVTYNSESESNEVAVIENIVSGIQFLTIN